MRGQKPLMEAKDRAAKELERRSQYLNGLIEQRRKQEQGSVWKVREENAGNKGGGEAMDLNKGGEEELSEKVSGGLDGSERDLVWSVEDYEAGKDIRVRATDMHPEMQKRAFRSAWEVIDSTPKLDSKRLAQTLKKEFDDAYGPAWHCIVGTSFGSYVTHSLGGFLYFSIDKAYILLFRTAVEPLSQ